MVALERTHSRFRLMAGSGLGPINYLTTSAIYFIAYLAINYFTSFRQFGHSSITLWSPDNAVSLLLLTQSIAYTPVVLIASICVDLSISHANYSVTSVIASEFVVTQGYLLIAILLRDRFHYDFRIATYPNMLALLAVVPASAAVTSVLYCEAVYLTGSLRGGGRLHRRALFLDRRYGGNDRRAARGEIYAVTLTANAIS